MPIALLPEAILGDATYIHQQAQQLREQALQVFFADGAGRAAGRIW